MKKILLYLILTCFSTHVFSQKGDSFIELISPPGIKVYLDNKYVGITSSDDNGLFIRDIVAGNHVLKLEKSNFKTQREVLELKAKTVLPYKVKPFIPRIENSQSNAPKNVGEWLSENSNSMAFATYMSPKEKAAERDRNRVIDYSAYEKDLPGAISSSNDRAFKNYWVSQEKKMSSYHINKNLNNIDTKTKINNAYYWLAKIKNNDMTNFEKEENMIEKQNPNMLNYINGTKEYYKKNWKQSRLNYTVGLFKTFGVKKDHLEYLEINQTLSEKQIYTQVANKFIEADYEKKEEILEKLILKSKGYKNSNMVQKKMAYAFLGGSLLSDYYSGNKEEALKARNSKTSVYNILRNNNDFSFNSSNSNMFRKK